MLLCGPHGVHFMGSLIHGSKDNGKHIRRIVYELTVSDSHSPGVVLQLEVGHVDALGVDPLQVSPDQQRHAGIAAQQGLVSAGQLAVHLLVQAEGAARWRRSSREQERVREQKSFRRSRADECPPNNNCFTTGRRPSTTRRRGL